MKFIVSATCRATIRETWEVEADSAEQAEEMVFNGEAVCIAEEVIGDEEEREVEWCEAAPAVAL